MGCTSSKLDDLPAVALCRDRCAFLNEAIQQRFALAESHVAYIHSLRGIGHSLHHFINHHHKLFASIDGGGSTKPNLPQQRKGDPDDVDDDHYNDSPKKEKLAAHRHSQSGSHLHLNSDSEDDDGFSGSGSLHHSDNLSPLHQNDDDDDDHHLGGDVEHGVDSGFTHYLNPETMGPYTGGFMHMSYLKNKATPPSVVYEERPMSPQRIYMGESSSSSSYYPYPYPPNNSSYPNFGYSNYGGGSGTISGFYGSSSPRCGSSPPPAASSSKPPPPPPSPPRVSGWDFLNPFESYDEYHPPYTSSQDSKELREEEGIPDLEDEDYQHEVVKEVQGDQKFVTGSYPKPVLGEGEETGKAGAGSSGGDGEASLYQTRPSESVEEGMEYEVHVVEKKAVEDERSKVRRSNGAARGGGYPRDVSEVSNEIEVQFVRAAESGREIAKMLEVGKLPYNRKHVSSKMLQAVTPSLSVLSSPSSTSKSSEASSSAGSALMEFEEEVGLRSRNLSSTLQKLYLWEKKLYNEVKAEEKMRVVHDRKVSKLKRLDERGAEAHKVDTTRTVIRSLSTKIRIAIQVVDKISVTINKIRDEELWPQLNDLIQGLTGLWKCMLECHQSQCQAIQEARGLGPIRSGEKLNDDHLEATRQLEQDLVNWTMGFSSWVSAQKGYVKALNSWLLTSLLYEPEETPDGIVPFSPGRIGAPLVFVVCNQWSQALERISENEVIDSMHSFTMCVLHLWEQDKLKMRQRMIENKDFEKQVRNLDREDQKIQKEIQALEKKMVLASGDGNRLSLSGNLVYQSDTSNNSLQGSLQRIFEAMERFTAESVKAYEELSLRA